MAEHLASIFGTEKDRVNCPFYFKIGACRHGDRCSRLHNRPTISPTLLLSNMYQRPDMITPGVDPQGQPIDPRKIQEHFEDFYEDLFEELGKFGEIETLNICDNLADHMIGNVYVLFKEEDQAAAALQALQGRFYSGRPIIADFSPVTDFREATCRQYEEDNCNRGGYCNFMHVKLIGRDLRRKLFGRYRSYQGSRSRSRSVSPHYRRDYDKRGGDYRVRDSDRSNYRLGLINPGDEVILFAPFYDSYEATLSMAGANVKCITLRPPDFSVPLDELKATISKNTRAILINTPHNPTGKMFTREELNAIASLCIENDVLVFTDEVYDKLSFEMDHISMASLPGMYERTVTMNSLGKTFSLTGWKIGWAIAPPHLTWGVRQAHSFLTFATCTPMQYAAAAALRAPESYYEELKGDYLAKKTILVEGLKAVGFKVYPSSGTYFVVVDHTPFGLENDIEFCEYLIKEVGVVAIPTSVFYLNPEDGKNLVRFTFCKDEGTLRSAVERMKEKLLRK